MAKAFEAIEHRMSRIKTTTDDRDLDEASAYVEGYIDALHEFDHISEDARSRFHKEAETLRDETYVKLQKRKGHRRY